jgi:hypothetical protein
MSSGGVLGLGQKLFAVPWQALTLDTVHKRFTMDVAKDRIENAPGFDTDHWPDMADDQWVQQIHGYYGVPEREGDFIGSHVRGSGPGGA